MGLSLIVARSEDNVIGYDNNLPWRIPEDLKHFKSITKGHAIIMGRKTHDSIGRPLPKRRNIVVSRSLLIVDGCEVFPSIGEAIEAANITDDSPIVIGGATIYSRVIDLVDKMYITEVYGTFEGDTFFTFDKSDWLETSRDTLTSDKCAFCVYERKQ